MPAARLFPARLFPALLPAALLLAALLAAGCGALEDDPPPRPFGPGSGGVALTGTATPVALLSVDGAALGALEYDGGGYFTFSAQTPTAADPRLGLLVALADGTALQLLLIAGRPDTPCRFAAALAARDDGFTIRGDGEDRINTNAVVFHEVWLDRGAETRRLACARLNGNLGVEVLGVAPTPAANLGSEQVHFVLNSIRP